MTTYNFQKGGSAFFPTLKERVDAHFEESGTHPAGNKKLFGKAVVQILSCITLYSVLVFFTPPTALALSLCVLLGVNIAVVGFNVMHEGGHQTFSRHAWMNSLSALTLNAMGGNAYYWKHKHNINHHTYTNVKGMDSDIDVEPFMRLHEDQPLRWFHRFQHVYWIFLYAISYLAWVFYEDFVKYFSGKVSVYAERKKMPLKEHLIFWFSKIMYVLLYVAVPIALVGWLPWLIGFLIITLVCGLTTSVVFQLAHVVETTQFHLVDADKKYEWSIHQMVSTSNFATRSRALHWLLGGLNFQVEHHLFPRISHIHYPAINRYVKEVSREYNVVYNEYTSLLKAVTSHITHLYKLGRCEVTG